MIAGPVFEKARTPLITLWDTSPEIDKLGQYVFGIGVWAPGTSQVAVDYAREEIKAKTAVVVATNGQWSLAVAEGFAAQFKEAGGKGLKEVTVNPGDTDFRTLAARIIKYKPDVLYAPLSDHPIPFWKQLHSAGYKGVRITSDVLNQEIINAIGAAGNGIFQTQVADPSSEDTKKMLTSYKRKFNSDCEQIFLTSLGYDAIHIAAKAMNRAQDVSADAIMKELYKIKDYPGAAGETTINEKGSAIKSSSMFVVEGKKLQLVN
jgi:branched-chain amino acid transport system substrate-binding protein